MEEEISLLLSAASVSPLRDTDLHGWINRLTHTHTHTFKYLPTEHRAGNIFHFQPEGKEVMYI